MLRRVHTYFLGCYALYFVPAPRMMRSLRECSYRFLPRHVRVMRRRDEAIRLQQTMIILLERRQHAHQEAQALRKEKKRKAPCDPGDEVQARAVGSWCREITRWPVAARRAPK